MGSEGLRVSFVFVGGIVKRLFLVLCFCLWVQPMVFAQGTSQEQQLISLINQKRVRLGLSPLRVDAALRQASALRARELDERYSVNRPDKRWGLSVLKDMGLLNVKAQAFISKNTSPLQFV